MWMSSPATATFPDNALSATFGDDDLNEMFAMSTVNRTG